jgi:hypothetical protein
MRTHPIVSSALTSLAVLVLTCATGCSTSYRAPTQDPELAGGAGRAPNHPTVRIHGIDGTLLSGELLNGTVTVDSGQGQLVLLTDHIHTIEIGTDADTVDSDSVKLTGKIRDSAFLLRNEHGVFTLLKDRIRQVEFVPAGSPAIAATRTPANYGGRRPVPASTTTSDESYGE